MSCTWPWNLYTNMHAGAIIKTKNIHIMNLKESREWYMREFKGRREKGGML